jgi:hypothetical protein
MLQIFTYYIVKKEPCQGFLCSDLYLVVISFYDILTFLKIFLTKLSDITMNIFIHMMMIEIVHMSNETKGAH